MRRAKILAGIFNRLTSTGHALLQKGIFDWYIERNSQRLMKTEILKGIFFFLQKFENCCYLSHMKPISSLPIPLRCILILYSYVWIFLLVSALEATLCSE
jgi:hypothetical protein